MKKLFITFILSIIWFIGFWYCACLDNVNLAWWVNYSPNKLNWITCPWWSDFQIRVYCKNWSNTPASWVSDYVSADTIKWSCWNVWLDYFVFTRYYWWWRNCSVSYNSDKLCYDSFSPAVSWLKDTINEIIPYIVFISIWLLLATIWYVAVRWLVNWLWKKIKSVFSSKRS